MTDALRPSSLAELSSAALTDRIGELFDQERRCLADFLWHLGEMDRRQGFLALGYPSTFAWCREVLKLSDSSTYRRITSARLLLRFPIIDSYLRDRRLCMGKLVLLREVLDKENHASLLEQAASRTEDEVKVLVATLRPRPEVLDSIRRLPTRNPPSVEAPSPSLFSSVQARPPAPTAPANPAPPLPGIAHAATPAPAPVTPATAPKVMEVQRPRIEPIDATRHSVKFTAGPEFMALLSDVRSVLSHVVPDGSLEELLRVCMQKTLEMCARRQRAALDEAEVDAPKAAPKPPLESRMEAKRKAWSRYVPAGVRREVWKRDGGRCAYVGPDGKRCGSTYRLQLDHIQPHAMGGPPTVENLRLTCIHHNLYLARRFFGEHHMARYMRRAAASPPPRQIPDGDEPAAQEAPRFSSAGGLPDRTER